METKHTLYYVLSFTSQRALTTSPCQDWIHDFLSHVCRLFYIVVTYGAFRTATLGRYGENSGFRATSPLQTLPAIVIVPPPLCQDVLSDHPTCSGLGSQGRRVEVFSFSSRRERENGNGLFFFCFFFFFFVSSSSFCFFFFFFLQKYRVLRWGSGVVYVCYKRGLCVGAVI